MSVLYLECGSGVNADLMLASLASLLDRPEDIADMIGDAGLPITSVSVERSESSGVSGLMVRIECGKDGGHVHHSLRDVTDVIDSSSVPDRVKDDAKAVFGILAKAESEVHGTTVDTVHFHEVGSLENIAAVVGVCMTMDRLSPDRIVSSPVCTGFGHVHCAHGTLPIPAPATAALIRDIPIYAGEKEGEYCTPTGAALLLHFVSSFDDRSPSVYSKAGCGLSSKDSFRMLRSFIFDPSE